MMSVARCLLTALVLFAICGTIDGLQVSAFNVKTFVPSKVNKDIIRYRLAQIIMKYDVILIQEIRGDARYVVESMKQEISNLGGSYDYVISEALGRSAYTETYAYFYKVATVDILEVYQYDDGVDDGTDAFMREPYAVHVHPKIETQLADFIVLGMHISPSFVPEEMSALYCAYETAVKHFNNNRNVLVLGDFNADCRYLTLKERAYVAFRAPGFVWLIEDDEDTTLSSTNCAYDRIIVSGGDLQDAVVPSSSYIFRFDTAYGLTETEAKDISDHYPVHVELRAPTK